MIRRRNSRSTVATVFGGTERRSRRRMSAWRASDRKTMDVKTLAAYYERLGKGSAPSSLKALRAAQKAINAIYLRNASEAAAIESAMMTLPANSSDDQLGEWYVFTKWAVKQVGRSL